MSQAFHQMREPWVLRAMIRLLQLENREGRKPMNETNRRIREQGIGAELPAGFIEKHGLHDPSTDEEDDEAGEMNTEEKRIAIPKQPRQLMREVAKYVNAKYIRDLLTPAADSEAVVSDIASSIARHAPPEAHAALVSALRKFYNAAMSEGATLNTYRQLARDDGKPRKYPITITDHDIFEAEAALRAEGSQ